MCIHIHTHKHTHTHTCVGAVCVLEAVCVPEMRHPVLHGKLIAVQSAINLP
jgi:hypothetical protein